MKKSKIKKLIIFLTISLLIIAAVFTIYIMSNNNSTKKSPDSSSNDSQDSSYYSSLYGTWVVTKYIPSNIKTSLSSSLISFCVGQKFTIDSEKISSVLGTIDNPTIKEGIMTDSDFFNTYNDTLNNIGITDNKIRYITLTQNGETPHSVTILITNNNKTYAILKGAIFELTRS